MYVEMKLDVNIDNKFVAASFGLSKLIRHLLQNGTILIQSNDPIINRHQAN